MERALRAWGYQVTYVGLPYRERGGWDGAMPVAQLLAELPEPPTLYLWIDSAGRYFPPGIADLPIPTACYLIDVHLGHWRESAARFFDAVFIAQKDYLPAFREAVGHDQVYWLPLAAAPDVHYDHGLPRLYDVGFVGNIARAHQKTARARRLKRIAERFHTNDLYRPYTPDEVGEVYSQSRIVFNTSIAGDVTMRVFEGTASGALLLTDSIANGLEELYEPGREIVTFEDDADLLEKIAYYLAHEEERARIAQAGHQRAITQHTYGQRVQTLLETVVASTFRQCAPMRTASPEECRKARLDVLTHLYMLDAIFDEAKAAGYGPLRRFWTALPCLIRRIVV